MKINLELKDLPIMFELGGALYKIDIWNDKLSLFKHWSEGWNLIETISKEQIDL